MRSADDRIEMVTRREANLLRFAHQAGLYCARPRNRANEHPLSRPPGDDPVREEKKSLWGIRPWRNARVKLRPAKGFPRPSAPINSHGFVQAG